jgi:hypothetical protein
MGGLNLGFNCAICNKVEFGSEFKLKEFGAGVGFSERDGQGG